MFTFKDVGFFGGWGIGFYEISDYGHAKTNSLQYVWQTTFLSLSGSKPLPPRNVKLTSVDKGLKVTWDPPSELDGQPVDSYSIGYGKSMKSLRFVTVDKDRRSELLEDVGERAHHSFCKWNVRNSHWALCQALMCMLCCYRAWSPAFSQDDCRE